MVNYSDFCQKDITLRDYQQDAKERIFEKWNHVNSILYQMPTGTGKTRLFTSIIRDISNWGYRHNCRYRILIIAHRSELIEQSSRSLDKYHIKHGVLAGTMKDKRNMTLPIQVASIQTITHPSKRCLIDDLKFDFIIIDEAHHAVARTYQLLWEYCPDAKKLGVTATPWRMNNGGFSKCFDAYIPSMSIKEFIQKGWLASYQYYSVPVDSEIIKTIKSINEFDIEGDFKTSALTRLMDTLKIRSLLYESYEKIAYGKKGIIYSISREHSMHICEQYRQNGISIENIDSKTPAKIRENIIKDFKEGKIDIIVNVDIFSEGFDCPEIEFIQLARPTMSLVKYIQQVGRGLRKNGEKKCIILDNVGLYSFFGLPNEDRDWESFFRGSEKKEYSISGRVFKESEEGNFRKKDISEGIEDMILVQDMEISQDIEPENNLENHTEDSVLQDEKNQHFVIRSESFLSKKYVIEENENGFFIVNLKTNNRMFLTKIKTMHGGIIIIKKESGKKIFTIVKTLSLKTLYTSFSHTVGSLYQEGLIWKFTSSDKFVTNKKIIV